MLLNEKEGESVTAAELTFVSRALFHLNSWQEAIKTKEVAQISWSKRT